MSVIQSVQSRFDRWLFDSYPLSAESWGLIRIVYVLYLLVFVGLPELTYLAGLPDMFFNPPRISVGLLFPGYPGYFFLKILGLTIVGVFLCILFGYRTRTASVAGALLVFFAKTFVYSTGQINHDFMVWLVPLAGACANWGAAYSLDARGNSPNHQTSTQNWPVVFLVIAFSFGLALSGYHKYLGGWANPDISAVKQWFIRNHIVVQREHLLGPYLLTFNNFVFWKALDYLTLIFEIGILAGILFPRMFRFFLIVTVCFHASNLLILNIDFSFNFAFYLLFLDWNRINKWLRSKTKLINAINKALNWRYFTSISAGYLIFFGLTESSIVNFTLNQVGIDYLGNAVVRTGLGVLVVSWVSLRYFRQRFTIQSANPVTPYRQPDPETHVDTTDQVSQSLKR